MKLRKHLRTKRLESIEQSGMDRVFTMTFGQGEAQYNLVVELYAAGNIVLTDKDFNILSLLRSYTLKDDTTVSVGNVYPHNQEARNIQRVTLEQAQASLKTAGQKALKNGLDFEGYEPAVIEHAILVAGLDPKMKSSDVDDEQVTKILSAFDEIFQFMESGVQHPGYIVFSKKEKKQDGAADGEDEYTFYEYFLPFLFAQFQANPNVVKFSTFNEAADEFFSKLLAQKVEQQIIAHETTVVRKLDKVREDHTKRIQGLEAQVEKWNHYAQLIEQNIEAVDECIDAIRVSLAHQIDWSQLNNYIKEERNAGNPLALMIHKLKLQENKITVLLFDKYLAEDEEAYDLPTEPVDIDVSLSAYANARAYYQQRKNAHEKTSKTIAAADQALKNAEKKAYQTMKETKAVKAVTALRKPFWFEKFNWFITSDNYIVVGGRDSTQNDMLYRRYLEKGDIYLHADVVGASSCIIKNPTSKPIPPNTLTQAGSFALCQSSAWKNKVSASAYWVNDSQVSKTAPTGEYIASGGFMIRGKKNYINDTQLVMGFGILFKVADESIVNHVDERKPKWMSEGESATTKTKGEAQPKHWQPKNKDKAPKNKEDEDVNENENEEEEEEKNVAQEQKESEKEEVQEEKGEVKNEDPESETDSESGDAELEEALKSSGFTVSLINSGQIQKDENKQDEEEEDEKESGAGDKEGEQANKGAKKKLTAYERRRLKKGKPIGEDVERGPRQVQPAVSKKQKVVQAAVPRGKKNKMKKQKEKYGWQDEEDRKLHMSMLGHKVVEVTPEEIKIAPGQSKKNEALVQERENIQAKAALQKERANKKIRKEQEEEELRQLIREEKIDMLTEEDMKKVAELKAQGLGINLASMTGKPVPEDILMYAMPICAPYDTLRDYKFKVKVLPGGSKKGPGVRTALHIFLNNKEITAQERDLIKAIPEEELILAMISSPKVSAPGLTQMRRK
eukprot:TRINITY_DN8259_c0_g1_i2.p1 TRINITY_DN8259_c0_g1~~TRINITY_DN8259_c0_g1_i2.p1  ORF type:complete len:1045 (-),score=329.71 TRINITY_DN8259_c0_g1_i2:172-3051(-)